MRIAALLVFALPVTAVAQNTRLETSDGEPRIVVTATKTGRVAPDRVTMFVTIEGTGETTADAAQRASAKLQAVTAAIRPLVAADGLTSMPYGVGPAQNINGYPGASSQTSFVSRYVLRVQPRNMDAITPLASAAIAAGASTASPPSFEATAVDSVRRARYTEALAQARRDAEVLAAALGGKLGPIIEVATVSNGTQSYVQPSMLFVRAYDYAGAMPSPDVMVSATVTVRYHFIQQ